MIPALALLVATSTVPLDPVAALLYRDLGACDDALAHAQVDVRQLRDELAAERLARAAVERRLVQAPPPAPVPRSRWLDVLEVALPVGGAAVGAGVGSGGCAVAGCPTVTTALVGAAGGALGALVGWAVAP